MTNNVTGTYNMHGLNFGSFNTSTRTLGGNTVRLFDFGGADPHITNDSSADHIINLNLEGDGSAGDPLKINLNSSGGMTFGGTINNQGSWVDVVGSTSVSVTATFNGEISGSGGLYKNNADTWAVLAADNTYSGGTTIDAGILQVGSGGTTGSLGTGSVTNNGTLAFSRASGSNFVLSNAISGTGSLEQNGGNIITIGSANTYSGVTTINSGVIRVTANDALGTSAGGTVVNNGGQLRLANVSYTTAEPVTIRGTGDGNGAFYSLIGANSFAGQITADANATIKNNGTSLDLNGGLVKDGTTLTLTGTGLININNTGISGAAENSDLIIDGVSVTLNATSTYNGPTYIRNAGTLIPAVANALPTSPRTALILDDIGIGSSSLGVNANVAVASLSGEASSTVNSLVGTTLTVGGSNSPTAFAGSLTLTGNLVKDGGSTQVFSGSSFSSGSTTVDDGVLELNNASGSATGSGQVTVNSGGMVSGTGRVATGFGNGVLVNGTFIAGSTIGAPAVASFEIDTTGGSGSTVFGNNSTLKFDLFSRGGDLTGNASAADSLLITGALSLLSGVVLDIADATGLSGWAAGDKWNLWDVSGVTSGTVATLNAPALGNPLLGWQFTESTGILEIIAVPEPSRALLLMLGVAGLGFRRRRRA